MSGYWRAVKGFDGCSGLGRRIEVPVVFKVLEVLEVLEVLIVPEVWESGLDLMLAHIGCYDFKNRTLRYLLLEKVI